MNSFLGERRRDECIKLILIWHCDIKNLGDSRISSSVMLKEQHGQMCLKNFFFNPKMSSSVDVLCRKSKVQSCYYISFHDRLLQAVWGSSFMYIFIVMSCSNSVNVLLRSFLYILALLHSFLKLKGKYYSTVNGKLCICLIVMSLKYTTPNQKKLWQYGKHK